MQKKRYHRNGKPYVLVKIGRVYINPQQHPEYKSGQSYLMNDKPDSFRRKNFFIIDKIFLENNDDNVLTIQSIKCECDNGSILDLKGWHDIESIYPGKAVNATLGVRINSIDQVDTAERCEVRISFHDWKNPIVCKLHPPQDDH